MHPVAKAVFMQYDTVLKSREIAAGRHADYKKWLRYYLDFCANHPDTNGKSERVRLFLEKLREKKQSAAQRQEAAHAVSLYFQMDYQSEFANSQDVPWPARGGIERGDEGSEALQGDEVIPLPDSPRPGDDTVIREPAEQRIVSGKFADSWQRLTHPAGNLRDSMYCAAGYQEKSDSPEWDEVLVKLAAEIKVRHYSRKTLKTYALWSRQFQKFLQNKPPQDLSTADVKEYLTFLAVKCNVAASTQNQAFNSLLFLFRHALKRDFGELRGVPRAKKSLYIPVVLSREEIDAIVQHLYYPYSLIVKLLFGCGLRLFECLQLRVRDFNFDAGILTVHGKGKKDRTVPLPESIIDQLKAQIKRIVELSQDGEGTEESVGLVKIQAEG